LNTTLLGQEMKTSFLSSKSMSEKSSHTTSTSLSSIRLLLSKYFLRNRTKTSATKHPDQAIIIHEIAITQQPNSNEYRHIITKTRRTTTATNSSERKSQSLSVKLPNNIQPIRSTKQTTTTATFIGQKRCMNELNVQLEDEEQQLVRARLSSRTSSLPAAKCITYYYCQQQIPSKILTTKAIVQDQQQQQESIESTKNSLSPERSRSQSYSSAQCIGNVGSPTIDTDHSSSFENQHDNNQRCITRCTPPSRLSTSYNSNRYSQRAIAQFMHERNKARLRRNQKASRMLGKFIK